MRRIVGLAALIMAALLAAAGCLESAPRAKLVLQLRGPAYPRPRCARGPSSLGAVNALGEPLASARVELSPSGLTGLSDASGRVELSDVPEGDYTLRVTASGFRGLEETLKLQRGRTLELARSLTPCVSAGSVRYRVGFDTDVTLRAEIRCTTGWTKATYTWTQLEGPDVRASVEQWDSVKLRFRTRPLAEVRTLPDEPQLLSFSHDEAGEYVFQVIGRSESGETSRDSVLVTSTNVTGALNSVPVHDVYYLLGYKTGPWSWKVAKWPTGWPVTIRGETTRTPWVELTPDQPIKLQQQVEVYEEHSGLRFSLLAATWDQVNRDCGRDDCHPALQSSWEKTRHGSSWRKLLDGELTSARGPSAESCATCHSLGYDPSVPNGGYDDVAAAADISFPGAPRAGTYASLPEKVKNVSNVYCLACHGPARVDPPNAEQLGRFSVGVCAKCHDRQPEQNLVAQWRQSKMSRTIRGDLNGAESREECARCHSAQGFYYTNFKLGRQPNKGALQLNCCENLAPITCQTCHSPMYALNKAQIFRYGSVKTRSGLDLQGVGAGALCMTCHTTDHDTADAQVLAERLAPHSPQAELSFGRGGYELPVAAPPTGTLPSLSGVACAKTAGESCVTCHMDQPLPGQPGYGLVGAHTFRATSSEGVPNVRPCQACHGESRQSFDPRAGGDYDGDGTVEGVRAEFDGLMALLRERLSAAIEARGHRGCDSGKSRGTWVRVGFRHKITVVDRLGIDLGDCDRNGAIERTEEPFVFPEDELLLHRAAYNYLFLEADKSRGLHNLPYAVKLLQRTVAAISASQDVPRWDIHL